MKTVGLIILGIVFGAIIVTFWPWILAVGYIVGTILITVWSVFFHWLFWVVMVAGFIYFAFLFGKFVFRKEC